MSSAQTEVSNDILQVLDIQQLLDTSSAVKVATAGSPNTFHGMPDYRDLTDLQLALLGVLWDRREASIGEVYESLRGHTGVTRKTVATLMSRLEKRGVVRRRTLGNEGIYRATVSRRAVLISRMVAVLGAVFESPTRRPSPHMVERGEVRTGDVARLRALLRKAERDIRGDK